MKRYIIIACTCLLTILWLMMIAPKAQAVTEGFYTYKITDGEAKITDCKTSITGDINIPSTLGNCPVTSIGDYAFADCNRLTSIVIGDSVTSIGDCAFADCTGLTSITIPDSVTSIGYDAFYDCNSLSGVYIADLAAWCEITYVVGSSSNPLSYAKKLYLDGELITELRIPNSVTSIGSSAFFGCTSLISITIPDSVTNIGESAFYACSSLTSIAIPDSVTSIGSFTFDGCTSLASITIPDSVTNIGESAFYACSSLTSITIPDSVTNIGESAFYACSSLTSIAIPDSVTSIGSFTFDGCTSLASITIPESVISIGYSAFYGCPNLSKLIYCGTEESWSLISIDILNESLTSTERQYHRANDVTCTKSAICEFCGFKIAEALGHSGGTWFVILEPTCTADGIKSRICDVCKETEAVALPMLGHIWDPADCLRPMTCSRCQVTFGDPAHDWIDATCTEPKTCTLCGATQGEAAGHSWSAWIQTKVPSCTEEGSQTRFCNCGAKETQAIAKSHTCENGVCISCGQLESYYWVLTADVSAELTLEQDLYIDLNGYDLSGSITTNGYRVYGMDSTTNTYSAGAVGYFNCVDENGEAIVPVRQFKTDANMTGAIRRYMAISADAGYSFHRFYLGITNTSLKPDTVSVGYKAQFYGDAMVKAQLDSYGYTLWLDGGREVTRSKAAADFVSGKTVTLRVNNFDPENYGETELYASVHLQLADGTVIESAVQTVTLRQMVESVNASIASYSDTQLAAMASMIANNPTMQAWNVENIYKKK